MDITLNCDTEGYLLKNTSKSFYDRKVKWIGIHINGDKVYGSSLKEIRHIIDYPGLHKK